MVGKRLYKPKEVKVLLDLDEFDKLSLVAESLYPLSKNSRRSAIIRELVSKYLKKIEKEEPQIFKPYNFKSIHD